MEKYINTEKDLLERLEYLKLLKTVLVTKGKSAKVDAVVDAENKKIEEEINFLQSEKTWNFNFISGGWNQISARTKDVAIERAIEKYNCKVSKVNRSTFRIETKKDTKMLMSLFY